MIRPGLRYPGDMITIDDARAALAAAAAPLPAHSVHLRDALGRRLRAPVFARDDLPPTDVSAMDGYAVRHTDLAAGLALPVVFEVPAGSAPPPLPPRRAARIFTGASLPPGADTVVQQELAERAADGSVRLEVLPAGSNLRRRGELFTTGQELARAGEVVTPQRLALLAAAGAVEIEVTPRPLVTVVCTGSELAVAPAPPGPGQIRDSNGPLLNALARSAGLAPPPTVHAADELGALVAALEAALAGADIVVTAGGVSVGDYDLVPAAIEELGGRILFHGVRQKPGKPVLAARCGGAWLLGLPGNPLAVLTGWRLYVLPLAQALGGDAPAFDEEPVPAELSGPAENAGRRTVLRLARIVRHGSGSRVRILEWKGSHDLVAGAGADALVRLEPGAKLSAGETVRCYPL